MTCFLSLRRLDDVAPPRVVGARDVPRPAGLLGLGLRLPPPRLDKPPEPASERCDPLPRAGHVHPRLRAGRDPQDLAGLLVHQLVPPPLEADGGAVAATLRNSVDRQWSTSLGGGAGAKRDLSMSGRAANRRLKSAVKEGRKRLASSIVPMPLSLGSETSRDWSVPHSLPALPFALETEVATGSMPGCRHILRKFV